MSHRSPTRSDHWSTLLCCMVAAAVAASTMDVAVASAEDELAEVRVQLAGAASHVPRVAARLVTILDAAR